MLPRLKIFYKKHLFKIPLTRLIYVVLNGLVDLECRIKRFSFPPIYLRAWKLDMLRDHYEAGTVQLFKKIICPGMTVIDIGAHIGYFTRLFAKLAGPTGQIYAFEPDPDNFALLRLNTTHLPNVLIYKTALSDFVGNIAFYHCEDKTGCHSTIPAPFRQKNFEVTAITLDTFVENSNLGRVDVIKMDIEGGESAALRGMQKVISNNKKLVIITEFNPGCLQEADISPQQFLRNLIADGFEVSLIRPRGVEVITPDVVDSATMLRPGETFVNILCRRNG